jgi:predicted ATPase/DNA-binding SARP family transcriptional activator
MRVRVLGHIAVERDGEWIPIAGQRERALLVALCARPGETRSADVLIDHLWSEDELPSNPTNALQVQVSRLRKAIGAEHIETRPEGYALVLDREAIDLIRLEDAVAQSRAVSEAGSRLELLDAAHELADQDLDLAAHDPATATRLDQIRLDVGQRRVETLLEMGRVADALSIAEPLADANPLSEHVQGLLMRALYAAGRQADALGVYRRVRDLLGDELGIDPGPELQRIEEQILLHAPELDTEQPPQPQRAADPAGPPLGHRRRLPRRLSTFVGRQGELAELRDLVGNNPLVTVIGPGGAGKTRLVLEFADGWRGRAHFVDLAQVPPGDGVEEHIVESLGIEAATVLARAGGPLTMAADVLAGRSALVILDNCEHVLDHTALAAETLTSMIEDLRIVATSRERLGVDGERLWHIPVLEVGTGAEIGPAERLFADRAGALDASFQLDPERLAIVRRICSRLDGLPLAIELAAGRITGLDVAGIAARLDQLFDLLTGGGRTRQERQQTLEATIEWSVSLLDELEADVFARLGATQGAVDLEAIAAIAGPGRADSDVLAAATQLVERSLLKRDDAGRYRMLETIRAYAARMLERNGLSQDVADRFIDHFTALAEAAEPHLRTGAQIEWLGRLRSDRHNLRHAVDLAITAAEADPTRIDRALGLCGTLGFFWFTESFSDDERRLVERALHLGGSPPARAQAIATLLILWFIDPGIQSVSWLTGLADEMYRTELGLGDDARLAYASFIAAVAHELTGSTTDGELFAVAVDHAERSGDRWVVGFSDVFRALAGRRSGGFQERVTLLERGISVLRGVGEWWSLSFAIDAQSRALRSLGRYDEALERNAEASAIATELGSELVVMNLLVERANVFTLSGRPAEARQCLDRAQAVSASGPSTLRGFVANSLGLYERRWGDPELALAAYERAADLYTSAGALSGEALAHNGRGYALAALDRYGDSLTAHRHGLAVGHRGIDPASTAYALEGVAAAYSYLERALDAAALLGAADTLREDNEARVVGAERTEIEATAERVRDRIGDGPFREAFDRGRMLSIDVAVRLAFDE